MKAHSGDALSNNGKQLSAHLNHRRPRSADSHGQSRSSRHGNNRHDGRRGARPRLASSSPAVGDRRRRSPPPVDRRARVESPSHHNTASPSTRHRNDDPRHPTQVFVVPSSPLTLPPSTRLDRIISPAPTISDSQQSPNDQGDGGSADAATTADDDERRTLFDVVLRYRSLVAAVVCVLAFLSPIVMVSIPRPLVVDDTGQSYGHRVTSVGGYQCDENCESAILSLSVRLIVIAVGSLAVFASCSSRMWSAAELPRLEDVETVLTGVVVLIAVVFWSFYAVRIAGHYGDVDYGRTVSFAGSMADTLLFVHALAALVLGLRCCRSTTVDFVVHVVRSRDGRSTSFSVSSMSVQRLALFCLRRCCVELDAASEKSGLRNSTICVLHLCIKLNFGPGKGSPTATNVIVDQLVVIRILVY